MTKPAIRFLIIFVLSVVSFHAQTAETESRKIISACPFKLREGGRTAEFRFSFSYILEADKNGQVSRIDELAASTKTYRAYNFVRDDLFIICMKKWRLQPAGKYLVRFYIGTSTVGKPSDLPRNYIMIFGPDKQTLIINLSPDEADLLENR